MIFINVRILLSHLFLALGIEKLTEVLISIFNDLHFEEEQK
jgi:hypothetical protein